MTSSLTQLYKLTFRIVEKTESDDQTTWAELRQSIGRT